MIEPIAAYGTQPVHSSFETQQTDTGSGRVNADDQQRFEELLDRPKEVAGEADGMRVVQAEGGDFWVRQPASAATEALAPPPTIGETILNGIQGLKDGWSATADSINDVVGNGNLTPAELMKLQFEVQQTGVAMTLILNEMGTFHQEVSQLLKTS